MIEFWTDILNNYRFMIPLVGMIVTLWCTLSFELIGDNDPFLVNFACGFACGCVSMIFYIVLPLFIIVVGFISFVYAFCKVVKYIINNRKYKKYNKD